MVSEPNSLSGDILYPTRLPTMVRSASGLHPRTSWSSLTLAPPTCGCLLSTARARPAVSAGWAAKGTDTFLRMLGGNPLLGRMVVVCSHVTCPSHVKRLALQLGGSIAFLAKQSTPSPMPDHVTHSLFHPTHPGHLGNGIPFSPGQSLLFPTVSAIDIHPTRPHHSPCV